MGLLHRKRDALPELVPVPPMAELPRPRLQSPARYLGTLDEEGEQVIGRSLSVRSRSRLNLSDEALDVVRMAGSFRIPASALRGATRGEEFGGRPVEALLVVRWQHGERPWRTGFRMETNKDIRSGPSAPDVDQWVRTISKMARTSRGEA